MDGYSCWVLIGQKTFIALKRCAKYDWTYLFSFSREVVALASWEAPMLLVARNFPSSIAFRETDRRSHLVSYTMETLLTYCGRSSYKQKSIMPWTFFEAYKKDGDASSVFLKCASEYFTIKIRLKQQIGDLRSEALEQGRWTCHRKKCWCLPGFSLAGKEFQRLGRAVHMSTLT